RVVAGARRAGGRLAFGTTIVCAAQARQRATELSGSLGWWSARGVRSARQVGAARGSRHGRAEGARRGGDVAADGMELRGQSERRRRRSEARARRRGDTLRQRAE